MTDDLYDFLRGVDVYLSQHVPMVGGGSSQMDQGTCKKQPALAQPSTYS